MKRIWFGTGLLIALLVLGLCCNFVMERTQLAQADILNRAAKLAADGDWAAARTLSEDAKAHWDRQHFLLSAFCSHEPMDQIDGLFAQLEVFSNARSAVSFCSTCVYLASQIEALGKSHSLNLHNFF